MVLPKLTILDVGHGQCAVLEDGEGVLLFDAGRGTTLSTFLEQNGINVIDAVVISHADADHIGGLTSLLMKKDVIVRRIYVNADAIKGSETWLDLRRAVSDAMDRGLKVTVGITTATMAPEFQRGSLTVEVLAPDPVVAMTGPGGKDLHGRTLNSNSMSVVTRIFYLANAQAVIAGDLDGTGLQNLLEHHATFPARLLVFPHHGGLPGDMDPEKFASMMSEAVQPEVVIFSTGRGNYGTPRPEIIAGVRNTLSDPQIACTQLSGNCAESVPTFDSSHWNSVIARGRLRRTCCAGSIQVTLHGSSIEAIPNRNLHLAFILEHAPFALCTRDPRG